MRHLHLLIILYSYCVGATGKSFINFLCISTSCSVARKACSCSYENRLFLELYSQQVFAAVSAGITPSDNVCAICQEELNQVSICHFHRLIVAHCLFVFVKDITTLKCNPKHCFHTICIEKWLKQNPSCPYDRTPVKAEDIVPDLATINWVRFYISQFVAGTVFLLCFSLKVLRSNPRYSCWNWHLCVLGGKLVYRIVV